MSALSKKYKCSAKPNGWSCIIEPRRPQGFRFRLLRRRRTGVLPAPGKLPSVKVQRVVDGDNSLRLVDGRNVRLIGLNTPEIGCQGRANEPLPTPPASVCGSGSRWSGFVAPRSVHR